MSGRYAHLANLQVEDDPNDRSSARPKLGTGWRLPKRWISTALVLSCIFILSFFVGSWPRSTPQPKDMQIEPSQENIPSGPLLGADVDATKLWFPPTTGGQFQPRVAPQNEPPEHRPRTPLLIAFSRNNDMLKQVVLSYIAAGWPREDIVIVDNSGTMDANSQGLLSKENPFFLDYALFRHRYGVSILQTPTLLNFAQLMNFYLRTSMVYNWRYFFWSHMDIAVLSEEEAVPYKSFHQRVLDVLRDLKIHSLHDSTSKGSTAAGTGTWAVKYFAYDWLTLVNVPAWRTIGQWDPFIPYYASDCDAYSRVVLNGFTKDDLHVGRIFDLQQTLPDPETKFFPAATDSSSTEGADSGISSIDPPLNSQRYHGLLAELQELESEKPENDRNKWQGGLQGGHGEPWTYHPEGFQTMWWDTANFGRTAYAKKWGTSECRLDEHGFTLADMWAKRIKA